jgi:hypothetical protein
VSVLRRSGIGVLAAALLLLAGPAAHAEKVSVDGTGSLESLTVNNKDGVVVLKLVAPGGEPCSVKYIAVPLQDRDGTGYRFVAGCYPGSHWAISLERGQRLVECPDLSLQYATAARTWTARVPRDCLTGLAGTIRAGKTWVDDYSAQGGEAGPTPYVRRSCGPSIPSCG